jgi:hypothetical protein
LKGLDDWLAPEATPGVDSFVSLSPGACRSIKAVLCLVARGGLVSSLRATGD